MVLGEGRGRESGLGGGRIGIPGAGLGHRVESWPNIGANERRRMGRLLPGGLDHIRSSRVVVMRKVRGGGGRSIKRGRAGDLSFHNLLGKERKEEVSLYY